MSDTPPEEVTILCIYCNAPWTADMQTELVSISEGCETCGYGGHVTIRLEIRCSNCGRVVYAKETRQDR